MNDGPNQKITVSGTVYWYGTRERATGAVIKATSETGDVKLALTPYEEKEYDRRNRVPM